MNKFNLGLHSALFFGEFGEDPKIKETNQENPDSGLDPKTVVKEADLNDAAAGAVDELDVVTSDTTGEVEELKDEIEFPNVAGEVAGKASSKYTDMEQLRRDRLRFQERVRSENPDKKVYGEVWTRKITEGFGSLIDTLKENGYFENKDEAEEIAKIKELYKEKVYALYETNIWSAGNKAFNSIKDSIFGPDSEGYPANEVYEELTGAGISVSHKEDLRAYHIEGKSFEGEAAKTTVGERKNFLAHKLPNYLFEIKDTSTSLLARLFTKVDKITDTEKKGIENFIDLVSKLGVKEGEDIIPEIALLKAFRDPEAQSNTPDYKRKEILERYGLVVNDNLVREAQRAGRFFLESQDSSNSVRDQRTLYLTIMGVIYDYNGMDNAIATFSSEVDSYEARVEAESGEVGKQMASGELLKEDADYHSFVAALGSKGFLSDAKSATRLFQMKDEYLQNAKVEDILADLNNDGEITNSDRGATKTGLQFQSILNKASDKNVALNNLLDHAKLMNSIMGFGLEDDMFTIDNIKTNRKLILLLQSIIAQPGEDFHLLLENGVDGSKKSKEYLDHLPDTETVNAAARKLIGKLDQKKLPPHNPDGLMEAVAGGLYTEYAKGVGLGREIPFDERVDGLSLDVGLQGSTEQCSLGVALSYNKTINLGKGWSVTPGASIGFIGMCKFKDGEFAGGLMASVGVEAAKQWATNNGVAEKISVSGHYTWFNGVHILGVGLGYSRDFLESIEEGAEKKSLEFKDMIIRPALDKLAEDLEGKPFDLTDKEVSDKARELFKAQVQENISQEHFKKLKKGELDASVDAALRFLANYNLYDLKDERVRDLISGLMADEYAAAWARAREEKIGDKLYRSGVSVGLSWVVGTQAFVAHLGLHFKKHEKDSYGDKSAREYDLNSGVRVEEFDEATLDTINREIGADEKTKLRLIDGYTEEKYVMIPGGYSDKYVVKVNPSMKGLMKKNAEGNGNILLDPKTPIYYETLNASGKEKATLYIGGKTGNDVDMRTIQNREDWFLPNDQVIDVSRLPKIEMNYTKDDVDNALKGIQKKRPDDEELQAYTRDVEEVLNELKQGKTKIIFDKAADGTITHRFEEDANGNGITVEYKTYHKQDMMSEAAKNVADMVYEQARRVRNNALRNISHGNTAWKEYQKFAQAMSVSNYEEAKAQLKEMLVDRKPTMDEYIKGTNFKDIWPLIENLTDAELGQALMSFNNVFARVSSVEGGTQDGSYRFVDWHGQGNSKREVEMDGIVEDRARGIKGRIMGSGLDDSTKQAYGNLIDAMEDYRTNNPDYYKSKSKTSKSLDNAIGINLGNVYKVENPLFNPEIYEGSEIDIDDLEFDGKDSLHRRALEIFANNSALMAPILEGLGLPKNAKVTVSEDQNEKGQITLDIDGENVIVLKGDLSVGYFAQCVNHMLLLSNIYAELDGGEATYSAGPSIMRGTVTETNVREAYSTTSVHINLAVGIGGNSAVKTEDATTGGKSADTDTGGTPTGTGEKPAGSGDGKDSNAGAV